MKTWLLVLFLVAPLAHAQVHKCTVDGKVTYSEHPCQHGTAVVLPPPQAPAADPVTKKDLARMQKESALLQKERTARDNLQRREDARLGRLAATRRQKCSKLQLDVRWAAEDARRAAPQSAEAAKLKARRAGERYAAECG